VSKILFQPFFLFLLFAGSASGQDRIVQVVAQPSFDPVPAATVEVLSTAKKYFCDANGRLKLESKDIGLVRVTAVGYDPDTFQITVTNRFVLKRSDASLGEVVISGTMRTVRKSASAIPVESYSPKFFLKNPTPSLFDALQLVNGIRPQLNCNVCNTGDIHINGLEGPYTLILIDGMPIVSSLASVYGISGIPNALVERIEVVKGPASSLYGSEAMGGLINVITKNPLKAPRFSMDISASSMQEYAADIALSYKPSSSVTGLLGINAYHFDNRIDANNDRFTDLTLQKRISLFNKLSFGKTGNRKGQSAIRYLYEDRWGGALNWNKKFRGTDSVYGESIYTSRLEMTGSIPVRSAEILDLNYSLTSHSQRSAYGNTIFNAIQHIAFVQLTWNKDLGLKHHLLSGLVSRYSFYDDNTVITREPVSGKTAPDKIFIPGVFFQHEWQVREKQQLLSGFRFDYDRRHGIIFTPRVAYKFNSGATQFRLNAGTGFRVVNVFTEDHAALTGAREVVISDDLRPERSVNMNLNVSRTIASSNSWLNLDGSIWYTYFINRIIPDYTTNANKIYYSNLDGYATSKGFTLNAEASFVSSFRFNAGITVMDTRIQERKGQKTIKSRPLLTERWSGTWGLSYTIRALSISVDYTGNIYGPMKLPVLSTLDPRPAKSPVWSIQNMQLSGKIAKMEIYGGVKNLLNWTPARSAPFLIARAHDPFDKQVQFNPDGTVIPTAENPYALTFDPNYVYAPNQGRRLFFGMRYFIGTEKK